MNHSSFFLWGRRHAAVAVAAVAVLVMTTACGGAPTATATGTSATPPAAPTSPQPTRAATASPVRETMSLVWWTPEFLSPSAQQPAGSELAGQLAEFNTVHANEARVEPVIKARYGKGGLLDYLLSAQPVAPSVLPDIVTLDVVELQRAAEAGLLQPLDRLLDAQLVEGVYPFAVQNGRFGGRLLAVQWIADFDHAAYLPDQVSPPPTLWSQLFTTSTPYLFALAPLQAGTSQTPPEGLSHAALSHYLAAGGRINGNDRTLALTATPLRRLLEFYQGADQAGLLPPNATELTNGDEVWSVFVQGQAPLALVSARRFNREHEAMGAPGFAAGPGWTEPAPPLAGGWALAIVTTDPERQKVAGALIAWLLDPKNAAASATATGWLPTSAAALRTWKASPYVDFLDGQLARASALPAGPGYAQTAATIQRAIRTVVDDDGQVDAAVEAALDPPR